MVPHTNTAIPPNSHAIRLCCRAVASCALPIASSCARSFPSRADSVSSLALIKARCASDLVLWTFVVAAVLFGGRRSHHELARRHDDHLGAVLRLPNGLRLPSTT
jgi:hypothetical protein